MDICTILSGLFIGIISGIFVWLLTLWGNEMLTRPKIFMAAKWDVKKTIYKIEKVIPYSKLDFNTPKVFITATTSDNGVMDNEIVAKADYIFYGIRIGNESNPKFFMVRRNAEIKKTLLILEDDQIIECRWWSKEISRIDKLFPEETTRDERRNRIISPGSDECIVVAYKPISSSHISLFDISSDVDDNFWIEKGVLDVPINGVIEIQASHGKTLIKIRIQKDSEGNFEIVERKD